MALVDRQKIFREIEEVRGGRSLIAFFNFDRPSTPTAPGLQTQFASDTKEPLYRVLKETLERGSGVDLCLYTRGGDTNSVWPIANLLREFDPEYEVLLPYRCHSAGTLVALGAARLHMTPLAELSPIDPSVGNQFNPVDPVQKQNRMAISVEDVTAYRSFVLEQFNFSDDTPEEWRASLQPHLSRLTQEVHPLALGNVYRAHQQIKQLGAKLLNMNPVAGLDVGTAVNALTISFFSHLHMIDRAEAREILGPSKVVDASPELANLLDELLRSYEDSFELRRPLFLGALMGNQQNCDARFIGAAVESRNWSYLFETRCQISQRSRIPPNIQLQLPAGQQLPLVPGLPKEFEIDVVEQRWMHNTTPQGVTL